MTLSEFPSAAEKKEMPVNTGILVVLRSRAAARRAMAACLAAGYSEKEVSGKGPLSMVTGLNLWLDGSADFLPDEGSGRDNDLLHFEHYFAQRVRTFFLSVEDVIEVHRTGV